MSLTGAFEEFRKGLEIDKQTREDAKELHEAARSALRDLDGYVRTFLSGSYPRGTRLEPLDDIDIIVIVEDTTIWDDVPETAMRVAGEVVRPSFPGCRIAMGNHAARIYPKDPSIEGVHLDVVVARATGSGTVLEISERKPEPTWIESDPEGHATALSEANTAWEKRLVPVIKMLKCWNRRVSEDRLPSFLVEALALRAFTGTGDEPYPEMVEYFFRQGASLVLTPTSSPAVPNGYVDGDMTLAERLHHSSRFTQAGTTAAEALTAASTDEEAAQEIWCGLFGDPFPKPDADERKATMAAALRKGTGGMGGGTIIAGGGRPVVPGRAYGGDEA